MKLKRNATNETVPLENGFLWSDEFDWKPIEQNQERAIDGTLIIQEGKKKSGRPITLSASDGQGWINALIYQSLRIGQHCKMSNSHSFLNIHMTLVNSM
jgi:hypothetical protein